MGRFSEPAQCFRSEPIGGKQTSSSSLFIKTLRSFTRRGSSQLFTVFWITETVFSCWLLWCAVSVKHYWSDRSVLSVFVISRAAQTGSSCDSVCGFLFVLLHKTLIRVSVCVCVCVCVFVCVCVCVWVQKCLRHMWAVLLTADVGDQVCSSQRCWAGRGRALCRGLLSYRADLWTLASSFERVKDELLTQNWTFWAAASTFNLQWNKETRSRTHVWTGSSVCSAPH